MLRVAEDGKTLDVLAQDGTVLASAIRRHVKVTSRLGSLRRKLEFPDGGTFETTDNDAIDALVRGYSGTLSRLERSWRLALIALLAIAAGAALFAIYGVPLGARWLALRTPPSVARILTDQTLNAMDGKGQILLPTALPALLRQQEIQDRFNTVVGWAEFPAGPICLLLRNAPHIDPNAAFALPDGRIVVTDQLVLMVQNNAGDRRRARPRNGPCQSRPWLAERLSRRRWSRPRSLLSPGDASQFAQIAVILPAILLESSYSRNFEQAGR